MHVFFHLSSNRKRKKNVFLVLVLFRNKFQRNLDFLMEDSTKKSRQDSENDDSTSSASSVHDVSVNQCQETSSSSSSNLNTSDTTNPNSLNELVVLPEVTYNIRIQSPGLEIFELPVTTSELVQEIHQVLMDKEETCHRTCFSLQLDGTILDNFTELKNIEGLKEGSLLKVIEG